MFSPVFIEYLTHFPVYPHQFIKATRKKLMQKSQQSGGLFLVYLLEWETHLEDEETHLEGSFLWLNGIIGSTLISVGTTDLPQ